MKSIPSAAASTGTAPARLRSVDDQVAAGLVGEVGKTPQVVAEPGPSVDMGDDHRDRVAIHHILHPYGPTGTRRGHVARMNAPRI